MATQTLNATQTSARIAAMLSCPDCDGDGCHSCTGEPAVKPLTPARDDSATVRAVLLPTGVLGWRVGTGGRIYADASVARRVALRRAAKATLLKEMLADQFERSVELGWN
jgi:hypothetical protein